MTHDPREALKPCPFCGGEAERIDVPTVGDDPDLGGDPNAGGSCIQCKRCTASTALHFDRKENLYSSWNDLMAGVAEQSGAGAPETSVRCGAPAALTASAPGDQQPVGYISQTGLDRLREWFNDADSVGVVGEPRFARVIPLYTSAPPAAGWDEAIEAAAGILDAAAQDWNRIRDPGMANNARSYAKKIRALRRDPDASRPDAGCGVREALRRAIAFIGETTEYKTGHTGANDIVTAGRSALSNPPAAVESNASAEARLREALREKCELVDDISPSEEIGVFDGSGRWVALWTVDDLRALSAIGDGHDSDCATHNEPAYPNGPCDCSAAAGDDAKKSEGGVESGVAPLETHTALVGETEIGRMTTEQPDKTLQSESRLVPPSRTAGVAPGPSDPTADRREIVARKLMNFDGHQPWELSDEKQQQYFARSDLIIAAINGGR